MSNFDPTTNRIPFGLLSGDEQTALINWPFGWEIWWENEVNDWLSNTNPQWLHKNTYRGKPAPVVTSVWLNIYPAPCALTSRAKADETSNSNRIAVLRIDTWNGVLTAHLEGV